MNLKFDHVLQFKIALKGLKPPIWRRIQIPCTYSFWDLHVAIQDAMGWTDSHLHQFNVGVALMYDTIRVGIPSDDDFDPHDSVLPGWELPIAYFFTLASRKVEYEYDFGDGWVHSVTLEKIFPLEKGEVYPRCIGGRRACPPEDCGGIWGYQNILDVLKDPKDEEYQELVEWLGGTIDPDDFDAALVHFDDPEARWKIAFQ